MATRPLKPWRIALVIDGERVPFDALMNWDDKVLVLDKPGALIAEGARYDAAFVDPLRADTVVRVSCTVRRVLLDDGGRINRVVLDFCHRR